jgi:hypothetical protein
LSSRRRKGQAFWKQQAALRRRFAWNSRVSAGLVQVTDENVQEALRMHDEVEKRCKKAAFRRCGTAVGEITAARHIAFTPHRRSTVAWQAG